MSKTINMHIRHLPDPFLKIGACVLWQAVKDVQGDTEAHRLTAIDWLKGADALVEADTVAQALGTDLDEFKMAYSAEV